MLCESFLFQYTQNWDFLILRYDCGWKMVMLGGRACKRQVLGRRGGCRQPGTGPGAHSVRSPSPSSPELQTPETLAEMINLTVSVSLVTAGLELARWAGFRCFRCELVMQHPCF